jgi:nucleotide-binding universal stress UspA family protein
MFFNKILIPINLNSKNLNHIAKAVDIARGLGSQVHFLFVNDEMAGYRHPTDFEDTVALKVEALVNRETLESIDAVYASAKGNLGDEVREYCVQHKIDLIIVGHKHRGKLYSSFFDSPDENIIDSINVPVLIIPKQ